MEIMKLIEAKQNKLWDSKIPTIAFLGDSLTQGCFEFYLKSGGKEFATYFDRRYSYPEYLSDILSELYPAVPINIVNAGVSGGNSVNGLRRLERDVLSQNPDLTVVCFGLNDAFDVDIDDYHNALKEIFAKLKESGSEVIFMTPNMMATEVSCHITDDVIKKTAELAVKLQNDGTVDKYIESGKSAAREGRIKICDVYEKWKNLAANGVLITDLLANHINHPTRSMNRLFAYSLLEAMMR
ncbi:MAG: GDSL family lipase [Clostridia bacterium]|nr:GDSL family lipase [Clostridia bacterium]